MKIYKLPDPKTQPDAFLVIVYKTLKRIPYDDRAWDKIFFARGMKRAQELLELFRGDVVLAARCMQELSAHFNHECLSWTIETIISHGFDWRATHQKISDQACVKDLLTAYTAQTMGLAPSDVMGVLKTIEQKLLPEPVYKPEPLPKDTELPAEESEEIAEMLRATKEKLKK